MVVNDLERTLSRLTRMTLAQSSLKSALELLNGDPQWRTEKIRESLDLLCRLMAHHIMEEKADLVRNRTKLENALRDVRIAARQLAGTDA